jgi:hypothetical protein
VTTLPYYCTLTEKGVWLNRGRRIVDERRLPWLVLHHEPPVLLEKSSKTLRDGIGHLLSDATRASVRADGQDVACRFSRCTSYGLTPATPFFHASRTQLVAQLVRQRAVAGGMKGLLSASIESRNAELGTTRKMRRGIFVMHNGRRLVRYGPARRSDLTDARPDRKNFRPK